MRALQFCFLATLMAAVTETASATRITYDLIGVTTSAGTLTGTVVLDSASDLLMSAAISFHDPAVGIPVFNSLGSAAAYNGLGQDYIQAPSSGPLNWGGQLALFFDTANVGRGALQICTVAIVCGTQGVEISQVVVYGTNGNSAPWAITAGSLFPEGQSAVTPEPPSSIMLGTGVLVFLAGARRRLLRR